MGYDVEISQEESNKSNSEFRTYIRQKIKQEVQSLIDSINFQINKSEFTGYNFNIYIIHFSNLAEKRKEIIQELT